MAFPSPFVTCWHAEKISTDGVSCGLFAVAKILVKPVFERQFLKLFALYYWTAILYCPSSLLSSLSVCLSVLSVTLVYCGQMVGRIKMKLGMRVGLGPGHTVLDGDPAPPPQRRTHTQFSFHICCRNMAGWMKMPLGMEVGLGPSDYVLDGDPAPLPQKGANPQFSADVYCGQMAGWIKMPLGMAVGVNPGHIVLDGDPVPPPRKRRWSPQFLSPCPLWPNGWMDQDAPWYGSRPQPRHIVLDGDSAPPSHTKGAQQPPPSLRPMSIVATVDHLSYC